MILRMVGVIKSSSVSERVGIGAGAGATVGALATLLSERPSLKKALRNALIGGAGGAAIGGGLHALHAGEDDQVAPSESAPPASPPAPDKGMNLGHAALSGLAPGLGPAIHGGITQDWKQSLGSGAASLGAFQAGVSLGNTRKVPQPGNPEKLVRVLKGVSRKRHLAAALASMLGATGAAAIGNKLRE